MTPAIPIDPQPLQSWLRLAGTASLSAVGVGLLAAWPVYELAGVPGMVAMAVGLLVVLIGALIGNVPVAVVLPQSCQAHTSGLLLGLGLRFALTAALALLVWATGRLPEMPLLLTIGLGQLVVLAVDVYGQARLLKQANGDSA